MTHYPLKDNSEVFRYLERLSDDLKAKGQREMAEKVRHASRFASGSASEFLHEAQIVLKEVKGKCASVLTQTEIAEITSVIDQLEIAFLRIGGA